LISRLVDADKGLFEILDTVLVRISTPYWTQQSDIDQASCRRTVFRIVDEAVDAGRAIATVEIVDVTGDETEPDISLLDEDQITDLDAEMESLMATALAQDGRRLIRWMTSKLNRTGEFLGLMTPFIVEDAGKHRQYIDLRFIAKGRKMLARGTFDIDRSQELAKPIFGIMQNMRIKQT
jgi:hypothetical protein